MEEVKKGGSFLIDETNYEHIFTPEDFSDEHQMIGKTTEDYILQDVVPHIDQIENHEFEHSVRLLKRLESLACLVRMFLRNLAGLG